MTEHEFIVWLKGFVEACNDFAPTPKQWDKIKEELEKLHKPNSITNGTSNTPFFSSTPRWDLTNVPHGTQINYTTNSGGYYATTKKQLND
jgi:hypothetical protein